MRGGGRHGRTRSCHRPGRYTLEGARRDSDVDSGGVAGRGVHSLQRAATGSRRSQRNRAWRIDTLNAVAPESLPSDSNRLGDHGVLDVTQARDGGEGRRGKSAQEEIRADTPLRVLSSQGVAAVLEKPQRHLSTREPTTVTLADDHRGHRIITE